MASPEIQMCREELAFHMRSYNFSVRKICKCKWNADVNFLAKRNIEIRWTSFKTIESINICQSYQSWSSTTISISTNTKWTKSINQRYGRYSCQYGQISTTQSGNKSIQSTSRFFLSKKETTTSFVFLVASANVYFTKYQSISSSIWVDIFIE